MYRVWVTMVAVVVVRFLLVGECWAVSPDLFYNVYNNTILQTYKRSFIKSRPCDCRMLCFTAKDCTAVSFIRSPGEVECRLSNNTSPTTLLAPDGQTATLVKMAFDHAGCDHDGVSYNHGYLLEDDIFPLKCGNGTMTKIPGFNYPKDCDHDGSEYKHGKHDDCYYKCYNGTMKMIFNPSTGNQCKEPFEKFEGNCYYYSYPVMTWCKARKVCLDHGGDLAVDNFNALKAFYMMKRTVSSVPWVGVRDNLWLNGKQPQQQQQEWGTGEPSARGETSAQDLCGYMKSDGLYNEPCASTIPVICQLY